MVWLNVSEAEARSKDAGQGQCGPTWTRGATTVTSVCCSFALCPFSCVCEAIRLNVSPIAAIVKVDDTADGCRRASRRAHGRLDSRDPKLQSEQESTQGQQDTHRTLSDTPLPYVSASLLSHLDSLVCACSLLLLSFSGSDQR